MANHGNENIFMPHGLFRSMGVACCQVKNMSLGCGTDRCVKTTKHHSHENDGKCLPIAQILVYSWLTRLTLWSTMVTWNHVEPLKIASFQAWELMAVATFKDLLTNHD